MSTSTIARQSLRLTRRTGLLGTQTPRLNQICISKELNDLARGLASRCSLQSHSFHTSPVINKKSIHRTPTWYRARRARVKESVAIPANDPSVPVAIGAPVLPIVPATTTPSGTTREELNDAQQRRSAVTQGGLADNSLFASQMEEFEASGEFADRDFSNMQRVINPRPRARLRWQRKMIIRNIKHNGVLTKEMRIARTERSHLSRSHFFKTSIKKLMPLTRQIAGKSIDEAIVQMRFSKKKAARDIRAHLIQARDEAVVVRGMGLTSPSIKHSAESIGPVTQDASTTPLGPDNASTNGAKKGQISDESDIYIAQAWVNRGPYGKEPEYRARGRVNMLRPPHTGISVLLKEEKTRTREASEKEEKAIRKRTGKTMWTQLPDHKIPRQSQYLLW